MKGVNFNAQFDIEFCILVITLSLNHYRNVLSLYVQLEEVSVAIAGKCE